MFLIKKQHDVKLKWISPEVFTRPWEILSKCKKGERVRVCNDFLQWFFPRLLNESNRDAYISKCLEFFPVGRKRWKVLMEISTAREILKHDWKAKVFLYFENIIMFSIGKD